jgi:cell filamentation protein
MALFDPFGDFDVAGYLQNAKAYKTASAVKRLEHLEHGLALPGAIAALQARDQLTYQDILDTHGRLFGRVYPTWAGKDRLTTLPNLNIHKGPIIFASPLDIRRAANHALTEGSKPETMRKHPGEVMGYLAYAHPFLEGNGRTILAMHSEMARRAAISIDWRGMDHRAYLTALTRELQRPNLDLLDAYLAPFILPNPDKLFVLGHQPAFLPPAPSARTSAQPLGDVVRSEPIVD